jgi:hypothetical protein
MSTSIKAVYTAVTLSTTEEDQDDVHSMILQSLLLDEEKQEQQPTDGTIVIISNPQYLTKQQQQQQQQETSSTSYARLVVLGIVTGFFIQVISLGAYALMLLQYHNHRHGGGIGGGTGGGGEDVSAMDVTTWWPALQKMNQGDVLVENAVSETNYFYLVFDINWFIYGILSVLTQIDLVIYVLIWIAFTCTMTKNGMQFLRLQSQNPSLQRRWVFVLGVYFLVGIVLGAFGAWSMIDIYLGFPIPFMPIVATVGIDLVLCYLMVCCYDLGRRGGTHSSTLQDDDDNELDDDDDDQDENDNNYYGEDRQSCVCC